MSSLRRKPIWIRAALLTVVAAAALVLTQPARTAKTTGLSEDKGRFIISVDGKEVGNEDFSIARAGDHWVAQGTTDFHSEHVTGKVSGELQLNDACQPLRYVWSATGGSKASSTTVFNGSTAEVTLDLGNGKPVKQDFQFASPVVVLDNNLYHQYEVLAHVYNWVAGGPQNFAVLIPQEQSPGTITVESAGPATLDGAKYAQLVVHTPDLQVNVYLDASHRLMRLVVPSSKAEVRRQ